MSTDAMWQTKSTSSGQTEQLGVRLGKALKGGEVIELVSDLGGGKTTLVRGLARGAGSRDVVASPTFTISKLYKAKHFDIHHFDFYRLADPGLAAQELSEAVDDRQAVVVVEWGGAVAHVLPAKRVTINIKQTAGGGREIHLHAPKDLRYLAKALD